MEICGEVPSGKIRSLSYFSGRLGAALAGIAAR